MPSGRPDWFGTIVAAGKYGTTYIPIALDVDGFITATMKGLYDSDALLKTIAVDSSGIMKANLSVQDLDFLTVRPAYGEAIRLDGTTTVANDTLISLSFKSGRGMLLGGRVWWSHTVSAKSNHVYIYVDDDLLFNSSIDSLADADIFIPGAEAMFVLEYDDDNFSYAVALSKGITFESKLELKAYHTLGGNFDFNWAYHYALVP